MAKRRRPYLEPGTYADYEIHGRIRLTELRPIELTRLATATIETWLADLVELERYAPKTINNSQTTLIACLNYAGRQASR